MTHQEIKLQKAIKKVRRMKEFYGHLVMFIFFNTLLLFKKTDLLIFLNSKSQNPQFTDWINWNIISIPIIWGIVLIGYGMYVFGYVSTYVKQWEQKRISKYMSEK